MRTVALLLSVVSATVLSAVCVAAWAQGNPWTLWVAFLGCGCTAVAHRMARRPD